MDFFVNFKVLITTVRLTITFLLLSIFSIGYSQTYDDHLGAGNTIGVNVSSSSNQDGDSTSHIISGTQLKPDLIGASRFLSQASLGSSFADIEHLSNIGIDAWLEEQFNLPAQSFAQRYNEIYNETQQIISNDFHSNSYMSYVFYDFIMNQPDVLRQKVAFALSQIFVISAYHGSSLSGENPSNLVYYDFLYQGAFGNYKDILENVTFSITMGDYLSHFQNQKADIVEKTYPDENYAREIMQLFSIGLHLLNLDGTPIIGANGENIPTYDINNIAELAKVFTGLGASETEDGAINTSFTRDWNISRTAPMKMFDDYHSKEEKNILPGVTIPAGQSGMQDIQQTLNILFNHQNVAPFISIRLIQSLVKSNPSPAYVKRIATVFNNNGSGVRGDLGAVVKAILLDPEARMCEWIEAPSNGKLIQPLERFTSIFKAFNLQSPSGKLWYNDFNDTYNEIGQAFLGSPSVFNFFSPFYAEDEFIAPQNLVSPEFQILNSVTAIAYINEMEDAIKKRPFYNRTISNDTGDWLSYNPDDEAFLDFSTELNIYATEGINALLDHLNLLLCRGQLSENTKAIIANAIQQNENDSSNYDNTDAVHDALYFIMMSPNYVIQK